MNEPMPWCSQALALGHPFCALNLPVMLEAKEAEAMLAAQEGLAQTGTRQRRYTAKSESSLSGVGASVLNREQLIVATSIRLSHLMARGIPQAPESNRSPDGHASIGRESPTFHRTDS